MLEGKNTLITYQYLPGTTSQYTTLEYHLNKLIHILRDDSIINHDRGIYTAGPVISSWSVWSASRVPTVAAATTAATTT